MTIYHSTVLNFNTSPEARAYALEITAPTMQPYIDQGYCSATEFYWDPPNPQQGTGNHTIRRVWTDLAKLEEWALAANDQRDRDPILVSLGVGPIVHNDDEYNPPA